MSHNNNIDADKGRRIKKVVDLLFSGEFIPEDRLEYIRQWLAGENDREFKNDVLEKKFIDICECADKPSYAQEMWPNIASRIRTGGTGNIMKQSLPLNRRPDCEAGRKSLGRRIFFRIAMVLIPAIIVVSAVSVFVTRKDSGGKPAFAKYTVETIPDAVDGTTPETMPEILPETVPPALSVTKTVTAGSTIRMVNLPDGSEIILNPGAVLTYNKDFTANRNVRLDGAASFKVAKDSLHPFTVESSAITVTVLGTEFSMKASEDDIFAEVTLTSGSVSVRADEVNETTVMSPGQRYVYDRAHRTIELHEIGGEEEFMKMRGMPSGFDGTLDELFGYISRNSGKVLKVESGIDVERHLVMPYKRTDAVEKTLDMVQTITGDIFDYIVNQDTITIIKPR